MFFSTLKKASHPSSRNIRAFSLVEMIVSMAIFSIVAVVALGALTKIIASNRKAQSLQSSITNLNFMLDSISRELRVGAYYQCYDNLSIPIDGFKGEDLLDTVPCGGSNQDLHSSNYDNAVIVFKTARTANDGNGGTCSLANAYRFKLDITTNKRYLEKALQRQCDPGIQDSDFSDVVDPNVELTDWYLRVGDSHLSENTSSTVADDEFPLVTIGISGYSGIRERDKTYFSVQTAVSPRINNF